MGIATTSNAFCCLFAITASEADAPTTTTIDDAVAEYDRESTDVLSTLITTDSSGHDIASHCDASVSGFIHQVRRYFGAQDAVGR